MEAYLNKIIIHWIGKTVKILLYWLWFLEYSTQAENCKSLGLLALAGFVVCSFIFILLVGLGFLGDDAGREAIQHQHLLAKSRVKLKLSKAKLIHLGKKPVISQCSKKKKEKKQWWLLGRPISTLYVWASPVTKDHLLFQNYGSMCTLSFWATVCKQEIFLNILNSCTGWYLKIFEVST